MPERRTARWRTWLPRVLIIVLYAGVAGMLFVLARRLDWGEVQTALRAIPAERLILAGAFSASCYACYAGYELLAARQLGLELPRKQVAAIGFAAYACNLTLGATLGAVGLRARLYAARGVQTGQTMSIVAFNLLTNWSGYLFVLGAALLVLWSPPPPSWPLQGLPLRLAGAGVLCILVGYLIACRRPSRPWRWRGMRFALPTLPFAFAQLGISSPVWLFGAASLVALLPDVPFDLILVSLMASAIAGLIVRIPAGLGVIEATVIASLGPSVGHGTLLAALLAYRCIHYLAPLVLGLITVAALEIEARSRNRRAKATAQRA